MKKLTKRIRKKPGLSPGTLVHTGEKKTDSIHLSVYQYNEQKVDTFTIQSTDELPQHNPDLVTWLQVHGIHDVSLIDSIGKKYNLHPLLLEDILNTDQRPKLEDYGDYLFIVLKMLTYDDSTKEVRSEQVSLVVMKHLLISFHENGRGIFDPVRERIQSGKGRIRKLHSDYLTYALMDTVIDHYYVVFEKLGEHIETVEQELIRNPSINTLHTINILKREILFLRKTIWPLREIVAVMERRESEIIRSTTVIYLRDLYDHTIQGIDTIETFRDLLTGMLDIYLSSVSNKTNEVIKVLTIIATIFIPLTFIVGIYGMNFEYMPELAWRWGYPIILGIMALAIGGMLFYFKRKKWI